MGPGQSHLISCCITVMVQSVGTVELQKVHLYSRAALHLEPGQVLAQASALQRRQALAHISCLYGRLCLKTGRVRASRRGADQPAQTACASCLLRPCPRPHPGPSCSLLVHAHCPHVCNALASTDDPLAAVRTAPLRP